MNNIEFNTRLINILKLRNKLKRNELVDLLKQFWKHNKQQLQTIYHYHCYQIIVKVLHHFDIEQHCHGKSVGKRRSEFGFGLSHRN